MHILIGILSAAAGLVWALYRLHEAGVDLNAFNPFTWMRRKRWEKQFGTKPMHALTESMAAAALLVVAVAKEKGEITRDTKLEILSLFEKEFGIQQNKALDMFSDSTYMLQDVLDMAAEVRLVLMPSKNQFQESHISKLLTMLTDVANKEGEATPAQLAIIQAVKEALDVKKEKPENW